VEGFWPIFFLLVVLKIPVFGALWLVWWASRAPEKEAAEQDSGGEGFNRWRPSPYPRRPSHGPGGAPAVARRGRAPSAELVSDRRERVLTEGCDPSYTR